MKTFFEQTMDILSAAIEKSGSARSLAISVGMQPTTVRRWKNRERQPGVYDISPIMDSVGARIVMPGEHISPDSADLDMLRDENARLSADMAALREQKLKLEGKIELLKEQLAEAKGAPASSRGVAPTKPGALPGTAV